MQQAPTILVILLNLSALLCAFMAAWAHLHARVPAAREFVYLVLGIAIYSLGYALEITRLDLNGMLEAITFEYIGLAFIPTLLLLFVIHFIRREPTPKGVTTLFLVVPVITLVLVFTQGTHTFYYINPRVIHTGLFPALSFERGPWYSINVVYLLGCLFVAISLLLIYAWRTGRKLKTQAILLATAAVVPTITTVLYFGGQIPYQIDPGPISLTFSGLLIAFVLFKMQLFELVPAARELALDSIQEAFLVIDKRGRLQDLNQAAQNLPGASGLRIGETVAGNSHLGEHLITLLQETHSEVEFFATDPTRGERCFQARAYPVLTIHGQLDGTAVLISDITETAGLLKQLSYQANMDELTGILNRRQLMKLGESEVKVSQRTGQPLGVILIDLDHFKQLNDTYGHAVGDEVLRSAAQCFRKVLRNVDILGRYGGEEFVVILPGANLSVSIRVAERLRNSLKDLSILHQGERIAITASFGAYAALAKEGTMIDDLLKAADLALYQAKSGGRDQVAHLSSLEP